VVNDELRNVAAIAGRDATVVKELDRVLAGPNDRAFVVCTTTDCKRNQKGRCTIFTVLDVPRMKTGRPCNKSE